MIVIRDISQVALVADIAIRQYIDQRIAELLPSTLEELGFIALVESSDSLASVNAASGFDVCRNPYSGKHHTDPAFSPPWEVIEEYPVFYVATWVTGQDGSGLILVVPKNAGANPELLRMCKTFSIPGEL